MYYEAALHCGVHHLSAELVIFHYHLFPGGVTNVVTLSVRAIQTHLPEIEHIRLVCGSERHLPTLQQVTTDVIPELFYLPREAQPGGRGVPETRELKRILVSRYRGAVWWVHNYHLGKNPVFTQALLEIAEEFPDQQMLFHIHDFPECARFDNLSLLERFIRLPLYPTSRNVRYAVINRRDFALLARSGIPESRLFLLNNPVPDDHLPAAEPTDVRSKLERSFAHRFPGYTIGAPLLFYPVRAIRRKNALEAGMIARMAEQPANLIVTLPGVSEKEAPYSRLVQESFERGLIPGMAGIGALLGEAGIGFQELALSTDCVVSSSVQEGFGYLFIDGRRWRKPVFARYLDILEGIEEIIDGESAYFYHALKIPIDARLRAHLAESYRTRAAAVARFLPEEAIEQLTSSIEGAFSQESVDFSYLGVDDQRQVLERSMDPAFRKELAELNHELLEALYRLLNRRPDDIASRIHDNFSLAAFASQTARILESFSASGSTHERKSGIDGATREGPLIQDAVHRRLRAGFATLEYIRLLYE